MTGDTLPKTDETGAVIPETAPEATPIASLVGAAPEPFEPTGDEPPGDNPIEHAPAEPQEVQHIAGLLHSKLQQLGGGASKELGAIKAYLEDALEKFEEHLKA